MYIGIRAQKRKNKAIKHQTKLIKPEKSYLKFYIMIIVISNDNGNLKRAS